MTMPENTKPTVIWQMRIIHDGSPFLERAVLAGKEQVVFEYFEGEDAMGVKLWLPFHRLPRPIDGIELTAKHSFIRDVSGTVAKNPLIREREQQW